MPTRLQLTQLCVTDDLIVFTDLPSIQVIKGALVEFKNMSGLNADVRKSEVFGSSTSPFTRKQIVDG